ncbi:MAG: oxidoreductase [Deltaproteobacteria bacterium]|nr:oxidoreductase [Deltaproteobacteria bacterium]
MGQDTEYQFRQVGTRPIRHDGVDKVTGRARFGADIALPGMLHGAILRSPHAHARILSIDPRKSLALEGVKAVITADDLPEVKTGWVGDLAYGTDPGEMAENIMARHRALYHGHALAAVAATSLERAREACRLIEVEYEVLEPVVTLEQALAPDAPIIHEDQAPIGDAPLPEGPTNIARRIFDEGGDLERGFAESDVIVEGDFETPMVHQGYIEPHACLANVREDGKVDIWCCTQGPFMVKDYTATALQCDPHDIKVTPSEIGGGFGGKTTIYLEPIAVVLSRAAGRPVKLVMTREEVFRATGPASGAKIRMKIGARSDGTLVVGDVRFDFEAGAYRGSSVTAACMTVFSAYRVPNYRIEGLDIVVNKPKVAPYRAPGAPNAAFAIESLIDDLARRLGRDPIDLRLQNAVVEGDRATYGPVFGPIGLRETLESARSHPHARAPLGENQGRGIASGWWFNAGMQSSATVSVDADGSAVVRTGNPDIGGSRASMALMVAEELGISVERVRPVVGDTDSVGYCDTTGGSRVTYATGLAVIEATRKVVDDLRARAATVWNVTPDAVAWREGAAVLKSRDSEEEPLSFAEITSQLHLTGGPVVASASVTPAAAGAAFGTHMCDVEVDPETGCTKVIRYTVIQDAGKAVHPTYVEGQFQGGAAQGIGWALNEEYLWDAQGRLENPGFLDYRMPVCSDLPFIDAVIVEVPNPLHPYGVRGVGETAFVPPLAAVANAVRDATGIRFHRLPMTPPRVLEAIDQGRR